MQYEWGYQFKGAEGWIGPMFDDEWWSDEATAKDRVDSMREQGFETRLVRRPVKFEVLDY